MVKFPLKTQKKTWNFHGKSHSFHAQTHRCQRLKHPDLGDVVAFCHLGCAVHIEVPAEADEDLEWMRSDRRYLTWDNISYYVYNIYIYNIYIYIYIHEYLQYRASGIWTVRSQKPLASGSDPPSQRPPRSRDFLGTRTGSHTRATKFSVPQMWRHSTCRRSALQKKQRYLEDPMAHSIRN